MGRVENTLPHTSALQAFIALTLLLAGCLGVVWPAHAQHIHITDDRGQTITLKQPAQRIVSLLPSLTESLCALGECSKLVGVDRYSNWPEQVRSLPQVGGGLDPNLEWILRLKPDVVLASVYTRGTERITALGIPVVRLEHQHIADVPRILHVLGRLTGSTQAPRTWAILLAQIEQEAARVSPGMAGLRVYVEVGPAPYGAGPATFIGELLARMGAQNILPPELGPFPKLSPEFILKQDPALIIVSEQQQASMRSRPGWHSVQAVRTGRICSYTPAQGDVLVRPGPRLGEAAQWLAHCLNTHAR